MCPFVDHCIFDSRQSVENHSASATFHVVDGSLGEGEADRDRDGKLIDCTERVGHNVGW